MLSYIDIDPLYMLFYENKPVKLSESLLRPVAEEALEKPIKLGAQGAR